MQLILLAAATWSVALGLRRCVALGHTAAPDADALAAWVSALSLIGAGLWAWQARSWLALLAGYLCGWVVLWLLPVHPAPKSSPRTS
jgi:hypothetical protein